MVVIPGLYWVITQLLYTIKMHLEICVNGSKKRHETHCRYIGKYICRYICRHVSQMQCLHFRYRSLAIKGSYRYGYIASYMTLYLQFADISVSCRYIGISECTHIWMYAYQYIDIADWSADIPKSIQSLPISHYTETYT